MNRRDLLVFSHPCERGVYRRITAGGASSRKTQKCVTPRVFPTLDHTRIKKKYEEETHEGTGKPSKTGT